MKKATCILFIIFTCFSVFADITNNNFSYKRSYLYSTEYYIMNGDWDYADSAFIDSKEFYPDLPDDYGYKRNGLKKIKLPYTIENKYGYATYHTRLTGLNPQEVYNMQLHDWLFTAGRIYVNNELVCVYGNPSSDRKSHRGCRGMKDVSFESDGDGIADIVIHVSNYEFRKGGLVQQAWFAPKSKFLHMFVINLGLTFFLIGALVMVLVYNLRIFLINNRRIEYLSLAVISLAFIGITLFVDFAPLLFYWPNLPIAVTSRLSIILCSLITPMYFMYLYYLYGLSHNRSRVLAIICSVMLIFELILPLRFLSYACLLFIFVTYVIHIDLIIELIRVIRRPLKMYLGNILILLTILGTSFYGFVVTESLGFSMNRFFPFKVGLMFFAILQGRLNGLKRDYIVDEIDEYAEHLNKLNDSFYRFVPETVFEFLQVEKMEEVKPDVCIVNDVMLLAVDIRNFTAISESLDSKATFQLICEYTKIVSPIIRKYNGFIAKYMGDGIIAVFPDKNVEVCSCAVEIQKVIAANHDNLIKMGVSEFNVGCAIHYGTVAVGMVGNEDRICGVACADSIRQVSKLESMNKALGTKILISEEAITFCRSDAKFLFEGKVYNTGEGEVLVYSVSDNKVLLDG